MTRISPDNHPAADEGGPKPPDSSCVGARRVGLSWFLLFTLSGLALLAATILLPDYAILTELEGRRDAVARQFKCEQDLAKYNERVIQGLQTDPVLSARYGLRHGNVRATNCKALEMPPPRVDDTAPARIVRQATQTLPPKDDPLLRAGRWLDDPVTMPAFVLLALGLIATGVIFFTPGPRPTARD